MHTTKKNSVWNISSFNYSQAFVEITQQTTNRGHACILIHHACILISNQPLWIIPETKKKNRTSDNMDNIE